LLCLPGSARCKKGVRRPTGGRQGLGQSGNPNGRQGLGEKERGVGQHPPPVLDCEMRGTTDELNGGPEGEQKTKGALQGRATFERGRALGARVGLLVKKGGGETKDGIMPRSSVRLQLARSFVCAHMLLAPRARQPMHFLLAPAVGASVQAWVRCPSMFSPHLCGMPLCRLGCAAHACCPPTCVGCPCAGGAPGAAAGPASATEQSHGAHRCRGRQPHQVV